MLLMRSTREKCCFSKHKEERQSGSLEPQKEPALGTHIPFYLTLSISPLGHRFPCSPFWYLLLS